MSQLKACQDSLSFVDLTKDGAQGSRVTWQAEAERLDLLVRQEKNSTQSYKAKWETMSGLYAECFDGYKSANDSLDFSVKLVNEHSGIASSLNETLLDCQNHSSFIGVELAKCRNDSIKDSLIRNRQASDLTSIGKLLHQCKASLEQSGVALGSTERRLTGIPILPYLCYCHLFFYLPVNVVV